MFSFYKKFFSFLLIYLFNFSETLKISTYFFKYALQMSNFVKRDDKNISFYELFIIHWINIPYPCKLFCELACVIQPINLLFCIIGEPLIP